MAADLDVKAWQLCHPIWHEKIQRISRRSPSALIIPHSRAALCDLMQTAQREQRTLIPCGNGTKLPWGGLTSGVDWLVSTQKLNRIIDHAVDDLTITVEAGLTLGALQAHLKAHNQFLPVDPAFPAEATLGGIVATADTGSYRQRYGGIRDLLLGITVIRTDGVEAKAGGKVVKNVAGYDLMKIFTGSYGSLATIVELTFRLYPIQEQSTTVLLQGTIAQIRQAQAKILNSVLTPAAADLLSPSLMQRFDLGLNYGLLIRFEAIQESITAQQQELTAIAQSLQLQITPQADQLWQQINTDLYTEPVVYKVGILPNRSDVLLEKIEALTTQQALSRIHIKSGLGTVCFPHAQFLRQFRELREFCQNNHGFLTVLDAPYRLKQQFEPWGYNGNALGLMRQLKQQFDPTNILSPQRFVGGI